MATRSQFCLFFGAVLCVSAAIGVHESVFNNFLSDTFQILANERGILEFPRELPGFLVVLMAGMLAALPVTRLGLVGGGVLAAGLVGLALVGHNWTSMIVVMMIGSAGMHLLQPVASSIAIGLSDEHNRGIRLGIMGAFGTIGMVLGSGFVWIAFDRFGPQYRVGFLVAAIAAGLGAVIYGLMHIPHLHQPRSRFVIRKKYGLYYALELLFGARKQIFITFGPWVLIVVYGLPASSIAKLFMISALIGIAFKPLSGIAIDRFGERAILIVDGIALTIVCLGYGFADQLTGDKESARQLASVCFILDHLLFSLGSGRAIYASRLAKTPMELTSTLSMGVSVNHLVSMTIPAAAGITWIAFGHQRLFVAAAVLALGISLLSSFVPGKKKAVPVQQ